MPYLVLVHAGILHLLCPQSIQAPCSYRLVDLYPHALMHTTHEIEGQALAQVSRDAYGSGYAFRYGTGHARCYVYSW